MFFDKVENNNRTEIFRKRHAEENNNEIDIAIGSKKITEMIKLELQNVPDVLNLSLSTGNKSAIRAAFYSAAFLLQRALADKLDVQPEEIEICEKIDSDHEFPVIYLSDALANGAGIVSYLYKEGKLEELIRSIVTFDSFDPGMTPQDRSFMQSIIAEDHSHICLTACQKCLLAYNNRGFHHVLDWRLGVGILNLMLDPTYDFGFSGDGGHKELMDSDLILAACAKKLAVQDEIKYFELFGRNNIIYHPLWNRASVIAHTNGADADVKMFNTFKVLRSDISEDCIDIAPAPAARVAAPRRPAPANAQQNQADDNNPARIIPDVDL